MAADNSGGYSNCYYHVANWLALIAAAIVLVVACWSLYLTFEANAEAAREMETVTVAPIDIEEDIIRGWMGDPEAQTTHTIATNNVILLKIFFFFFFCPMPPFNRPSLHIEWTKKKRMTKQKKNNAHFTWNFMNNNNYHGKQ